MKVNFVLSDHMTITDDLSKRCLILKVNQDMASLLPYKGKTGAQLAQDAAQVSRRYGLDLGARNSLCGVLLLVAKKEELLEDMEACDTDKDCAQAEYFWQKWVFARKTLGVYAKTLELPVIDVQVYFDESVLCAQGINTRQNADSREQ